MAGSPQVTITIAKLSGRCASAEERGSGYRWHALEGQDVAERLARDGFHLGAVALCGAKPGRRSAVGWCQLEGITPAEPTCPRCAKRLARLQILAPAAAPERFADGQLVRVTSGEHERKTGRIVTALMDNGPKAAGLVLYEVEMRDGLKTLRYFEPGELAAVRRGDRGNR